MKDIEKKMISAPAKEKKTGSEPKKSKIRENLEALFIAACLALFVREFMVQPFKIPSASMVPTLLIGDFIFVNKFIYGIRVPFKNTVLIPISRPKRGDVVVFKYPRDPSLDYIKRVIAVEGDTVEMKKRQIFINGEPVADPTAQYLNPDSPAHMDNFGPIEVPPNKYFVMGDNRNNSADSRIWGFVDFEALRGKAFLIYFSKVPHKMDVRWGRIFDGIH